MGVIEGRSCSRFVWFEGLRGYAVGRVAADAPAVAAVDWRLGLPLMIESVVLVSATALAVLRRSGIVKVLSACGEVRRFRE